MDKFDELIKSKIKNEKWETSKDFNNVIKDTLNNLENKKIKKRIPHKIMVAVAMIFILNVTTVFAMTPQGKDMIRGFMGFFNGQGDYKYVSDKKNFEKFNSAVGVSAEDKEIKVTLDNIAVDDNFFNTFYTIESKEPIKKCEEDTPWTANFTAPFLTSNINNDNSHSGNNNDIDAYFQSDKIMKVMKRENISQIKLKDTFDLKITCDEIFNKKGNWIIDTKVAKNEVKAETVSVNPNKKAIIKMSDFKHDINIEKVTISPFGNQIVISEKTSEDRFFSRFALYDDKGNSLDVLNTDLRGSSSGKVTNSYEFIKANKDIKYIKLVPVEWEKRTKEVEEIKMDWNNEPLTFDVSENGKLIIEDIKYDKNVLKMNYKKDGVVEDSSFFLYDESGKDIDSGDIYLTDKIDRQNGIYTKILTFENKNIDLSKIKKIGIFKQDDFKLLKDQAIRIDLK